MLDESSYIYRVSENYGIYKKVDPFNECVKTQGRIAVWKLLTHLIGPAGT